MFSTVLTIISLVMLPSSVSSKTFSSHSQSKFSLTYATGCLRRLAVAKKSSAESFGSIATRRLDYDWLYFSRYDLY